MDLIKETYTSKKEGEHDTNKVHNYVLHIFLTLTISWRMELEALDTKACQNIFRLMCWSHTHRTILPQIKRIKNKEIEKSLIKDIEEIQ